MLINGVIKREVLEGEKADEAKKKIMRSANKALRAATPKKALVVESGHESAKSSKADGE